MFALNTTDETRFGFPSPWHQGSIRAALMPRTWRVEMVGTTGESSKIGLLGKIWNAAGVHNYTTEKITELSKTAADLSPDGRSSVIDSAIRKLEKHSQKNQTFENQTAVLDDPKTQKLASAIMRMSEHWNEQQQTRIDNLSSGHKGLNTVLREQLIAVDKEPKSLPRGIEERSSDRCR
jgi:hypothetical protein